MHRSTTRVREQQCRVRAWPWTRGGTRLFVALVLAALSSSCAPAAAIFEDQVGMYDWYQQHIGRVTGAEFLTGGQRKRVYVTTENGIVAALNLRKGDIAWRRVLGENARFGAMRVVGKYVVTLTTEGVVSAWVLADGTLAWDALLPLPLAPGTPTGDASLALISLPWESSLKAGRGPAGGEQLVVLFGGALFCLSARNGETLWSTQPAASLATRLALYSPDTLLLLSLRDAHTVTVDFLSSATGSVAHLTPLHSSQPLDARSLTLLPQPCAALATLLNAAATHLITVATPPGTSPSAPGGGPSIPASLELRSTAVASLLPEGTPHGSVAVQALGLPATAWLRAGQTAVLLGFAGEGGAPHAVEAFPETAGLGAGLLVPLPSSDGGAGGDCGVTAVATVGAGASPGVQQLTVEVLELVGGGPSGAVRAVRARRESFPVPLHRGTAITGLYLNAYSRQQPAVSRGAGLEGGTSRLGAVGFRFLCVGAEDSLSLLQQEEVVWAKEEALAGVLQAEAIDLPPEPVGGLPSVAAVEHRLEDWVKNHWLQAKASLLLATPEEQSLVQELRTNAHSRTLPFRDRHGFRRTLVLLTAAGKLLGLHTGNGSVLWGSLLKLPGNAASHAAAGPGGGDGGARRRLFVWKAGAAAEAPQVGVVSCFGAEPGSVLDGGAGGRGADVAGSARSCWLSVVDGYTGAELGAVELPRFAELAGLLPATAADAGDGRRPLLLAEKGEGGGAEGAPAVARFHVFPCNKAAGAALEGRGKTVFFYAVDADAGEVRGYAVGDELLGLESSRGADGGWLAASGVLGGNGGCAFAAVPTWRLALPRDTGVVAAVAHRAPNEAVHTQVRVTPDRGVEYKLLDPNLLFLATASPRPAGAPGVPGPADNAELVVYVLDTVTGRVVTRRRHLDAAGPVRALFCENWAVYHFYNTARQGYQVAVLELLDGSHEEDGPLPALAYGLGLPAASNLTAPLSSGDVPWEEVRVLEQSYSFPYPAYSLAVTQTRGGITNRHVLFATALGQVLGMDRRFLDPRRKAEPTAAEKEAGIIPFADSLPVDPKAYLTHSLRVERLRGVVSFPTHLESTTLVFAWGVDLFLVRLAPSNVFDSLTEDFSFSLLLVTIVALLLAIVISWVWVQRQELRSKWL